MCTAQDTYSGTQESGARRCVDTAAHDRKRYRTPGSELASGTRQQRPQAASITRTFWGGGGWRLYGGGEGHGLVAHPSPLHRHGHSNSTKVPSGVGEDAGQPPECIA